MGTPTTTLLHSAITGAIIESFYEVHRELGFGFRELIYSLALERVLVAKGHKVDREVAVMVYFRGEPLAWQTMDMIVDDKVLVENKALKQLPADASEQPFGYLCATDLEVGLLLHFGPKPRFFRLFFENRFKRRSHNR